MMGTSGQNAPLLESLLLLVTDPAKVADHINQIKAAHADGQGIHEQRQKEIDEAIGKQTAAAAEAREVQAKLETTRSELEANKVEGERLHAVASSKLAEATTKLSDAQALISQHQQLTKTLEGEKAKHLREISDAKQQLLVAQQQLKRDRVALEPRKRQLDQQAATIMEDRKKVDALLVSAENTKRELEARLAAVQRAAVGSVVQRPSVGVA